MTNKIDIQEFVPKDAPPRYRRAPRPSKLDPFKRTCTGCCKMTPPCLGSGSAS